jgi:asparagine synthase (glutamine-hydrolysing)
MCGIAGVLSAEAVHPHHVEQMCERLRHRGPDNGDLWLSADRTVCLGHRRLTIVDLSAEANQPFVCDDGRFVITFNGEIYNFKGLRLELEAIGARFRTTSDTEVLVEAFRHWGESGLARLSGMYSFAIWDTAKRRLFCARDRAGEKPFYYAVIDGAFVFASELKALVSWPGFSRELNYEALLDYLYFGFVPDPKSIWAGCYKLAPGHSMWVTLPPDGSPSIASPTAYWDIEFDPDYSVGDWRPAILEVLEDASREMSFADVPVGAFLSGGVDSSSVTAALSKADCDVKTFTVGFQEDGYDERRWGREVATLYKTSHLEKVVTADDVPSVFETLLWHYDEPFNDYSYLPTYYLCREARGHITVALSGDGGDELFCGYDKYRRLAMRETVDRFVPSFAAPRLASGINSLLPQSHQFRGTLSQYGMGSSEMMAGMLNLGLSLPSLRASVRGALEETLREYSPVDTVTALLRKAPPSEVGLLNSMRYLDLKLTLAGDILVKVDRASMAVSLEVRPVYLHRSLLDLAARIPSSQLATRNASKRILKAALRSWLPDSVLYRKKMGFAMPLQTWIGGGLKEFFSTSRANGPICDLIDERALVPAANGSTGGGGASVTHNLFFLRRWLDKWVA